jgi:hypothetical protein
MTEGKPAAEKAVTRFHQMLAQEEYDEIYDQSSDLMKGAAAREDMLKLFRMVNSRLGKVVSTEAQSWKVGNYNLTSTVTLVNATQFEKGKGTEQFVFAIDGKEAKLAGYHINSLDLLSE